MESNDAILDVADPMNYGEYQDLGSLYSAEHTDLSEREIARKMAEDQTYYKTPAEGQTAIKAIQNYWSEMNIPVAEREQFTPRDILYGTPLGRKVYDKYYGAIGEYRKSLIASGYSSREAGKIISQQIFGSP